MRKRLALALVSLYITRYRSPFIASQRDSSVIIIRVTPPSLTRAPSPSLSPALEQTRQRLGSSL